MEKADNIERRLAAILSADVHGYSRMMAADDVATVREVKRCREIIDAHVREHHGRIVDAPGDNVLAEFPSAVEAVQCAVEVQRELADRSGAREPAHRMEFRIGIDVGDVILEDGKIYGDGVNIAARLEALATPGGICISSAVHEQIRGKLDIDCEDIGEQRVKNIPRPVRVLRVRMENAPPAPPPGSTSSRLRRVIPVIGVVAVVVLLAVAGWRSFRSQPTVQPAAATNQAIRSIAVLPLENLSGDPTQEFFADGMTEELITDLAKISALRVISRTSVMQFKGEHRKPLPEIARMLNVDAIIEGSVLRMGDKVRITAQLIDAPTDKHMWAQSYERDSRDVIAMQDEVASAIANQINVELTPKEKQRLTASSSAVNPAAYEAYLKGRYYYFTGIHEDEDKTRDYFQQSIDADPTFALGYAGLSEYYWGAAAWLSPGKSIPKAKELARKALELDPSLAEAHAALGLVEYSYDFNWAAAEAEFRRAIALSPNSVIAHWRYGEMLQFEGRFAESFAEQEKARQLDPLNPTFTVIAAVSLGSLGQFDKGLGYCRQAEQFQVSPHYWPAHFCLFVLYSEMGKTSEALAEGELALGWSATQSSRADREFMHGSFAASYVGSAYAVSGNRVRALEIIDHLDDLSRERYISSCAPARIYVGLGDKEKALDLLEKCYNERSAVILDIKTGPEFGLLRSDPRFIELLKKIGLDNPADDEVAQGFDALGQATADGNARARNLFQAAIDRDPKHSVAYVGLGTTFWYPWVVQWDSDPASLDKALELGRRAVALDDFTPFGHIFLAEVYVTNGQYDQAIDEAKRPIAQFPGAAGVYPPLAFVLNLSGRPAEAIEQLKRSTQLDARDKHLDLLGWSYSLSGRYAESIADEKEFVAQNPNPLLPHLVLAFDYAQLGKLDAARAEAKEILRLSPKFTIDGMRHRTPYKDANETERWASALCGAGLS